MTAPESPKRRKSMTAPESMTARESQLGSENVAWMDAGAPSRATARERSWLLLLALCGCLAWALSACLRGQLRCGVLFGLSSCAAWTLPVLALLSYDAFGARPLRSNLARASARSIQLVRWVAAAALLLLPLAAFAGWLVSVTHLLTLTAVTLGSAAVASFALVWALLWRPLRHLKTAAGSLRALALAGCCAVGILLWWQPGGWQAISMDLCALGLLVGSSHVAAAWLGRRFAAIRIPALLPWLLWGLLAACALAFVDARALSGESLVIAGIPALLER